MTYKTLFTILATAVFFPLITTAAKAKAEAKFECPKNANTATFFVDGIGINANNYQPRIHFRGENKDSWAYLAYGEGLNKDNGKAIYSLALTAYATGAQVSLLCSSKSVDALWISDAGGKSPD